MSLSVCVRRHQPAEKIGPALADTIRSPARKQVHLLLSRPSGHSQQEEAEERVPIYPSHTQPLCKSDTRDAAEETEASRGEEVKFHRRSFLCSLLSSLSSGVMTNAQFRCSNGFCTLAPPSREERGLRDQRRSPSQP